MPNVTVLGSNATNTPPNNSTVWTVPGGFNQAQVLSAAQALASAISTAITSGSDVAFTYTGSPPSSLPDSQAGVLYVGNVGNPAAGLPAPATTVPLLAGYPGLVDNSTGPITITGSGGASLNHPVSIIAGTGGISYVNTTSSGAAAGSGTIIAAGGNNAIAINGAASLGGGYDILLDSGNNSIVAAGGSNTINAGNGTNAVTLGAGNNVFFSNGTDVVTGGSGPDTINVQTGSVSFTGGSGSVFFNSTSTLSSTVIGGTGAVTAFGGTAGGLFQGGSGGGNFLVGVGGNTTLVAGGGSGNYVNAGNGAASISGGSGKDTIAFGAGSDTFSDLNNRGTPTPFTFPNTNSELFTFNAANTAGAKDVISNFIVGADSISLTGYSAAPTVTLINNGVTVPNGSIPQTGTAGWNTQITLSDNTQITIMRASTITHSSTTGIS